MKLVCLMYNLYYNIMLVENHRSIARIINDVFFLIFFVYEVGLLILYVRVGLIKFSNLVIDIGRTQAILDV